MKPEFNFDRIFRKHKDINFKEWKEGSDIMPAFAHDFGNYVARYGMGNFQIQTVIKLDQRIDFDKLSRAVRLSVDSEPVLGCTFVEHDPPYWKRLEDIDNTIFCSMEEADVAEPAIERYLETPLDMDHDPMVKVKLIRSQQYDSLVIKLNHTCCDGAGAKEYLHLLSHIYTCIDSKNGIYEPKPSRRSREDHDKVYSYLGIKHPELDYSIVDSPRTVWPFRWKSGGNKEKTPFVICRLPSGQLDVMSKFAKEKGATINDLILTAFFRAMFKKSKPPYGIPMDIGVTLDLRRYLPDNKASAIRNFSGGIVIRISRKKGESFEETLGRVTAIMNHKKKGNPGYQCATGAERAEKMLSFHQFLSFSRFISKASDRMSQKCFYCSPGLSNVGLISKSLIKFGENTVTDAFIIPPVIHAPGIVLVASSYNGILTFAVGYYNDSVDPLYMGDLLDKIKSELMDGCNS